MAKYGKAGCENPATSQRSDVLATKHSKPVAAMAGSFSRKISAGKAGQEVAGESNLVKISFSSKSPGKQTWKGASSGYTTREAPKYTPAWNSSETPDRAEQSVKGQSHKRTPEAKSVAGKSGKNA